MAKSDGSEPDTLETLFDEEAPSDEEMEATGLTLEHEKEDEAVEASEEAPEAPSKPVEEPKEEKQTTVPYGALAEERERRKALESESQKNRELMARMEERFKALQEKLTPPETPPPSYEDDPAEHLKTRLDRVEGLTREQMEARQISEQQAAQMNQVRQFQNVVSSKEQEFAQQTPDYYEAIQTLRRNQVNEMVSTGYDQTQAEEIINQYAFEIAARNIQAGKNPAEAFYELAKLRGYQPKGQVEKLQTVSQGMSRAASLGPGGESGKGELSLQELAGMSDEEFAKATTGSNWAKLWH